MCANRCKVHINIRKTTCLSFSLSLSAKHETFLFFSTTQNPRFPKLAFWAISRAKSAKNWKPHFPSVPVNRSFWNFAHANINRLYIICNTFGVLNITFSTLKWVYVIFEGLILCCHLHKQEHVKVVFFSDSNTRNFDTSNHAHTNLKGCGISHASCVYPWFLISSILLSFIDDSFFRPPQTCVLDTF